MITFGPVPSRRLGRSLGINNIPPKGCTYSCVYCQLGRTKKMEVDLRAFYDPEEIRKNIAEKLKLADSSGEPVDFLTYVSDGEPSLDIHLGQEIELIQPFDIPIAVITNSSLIWRDSVKESLNKADWLVMDRLIENGLMVKKTFQGKMFYVRKLFAPRNNEMLGLRME